jgi:hypothetical protein
MKKTITLIIIAIFLQGVAIISLGVSQIHSKNRIVWTEKALDYNVQRPCDRSVQTCVMVGEFRK